MTAPGDVVVFGGPSLPADATSRWRDVVFRPPARAGDVMALLADPPRAVALIDGCFDSCASVWHKELLMLAASGTWLFGAASIGALRAAELDGLGMTGVGVIFHAYRCGLLTGDDEVALLHAPAELGWRALTIPMVQVRAALCLGLQHGNWDMDLARAIRSEVHDIHFADRDAGALTRLFADRLHVFEPLLRFIDDPLAAVKQRDAIRCIDVAVTAPVARSCITMPPLTCFVRDLAARVGVRLRSDEAPSQRSP